MANEEHLEILKKGVEKWNEWREKNPEIRPNLFGANLIEKNLSTTNLSVADLRYANLTRVNLNLANLSKANLSWANLRKTNLSDSNLNGANLRWANLSKADIRRADISDVDFTWANLDGVDLKDRNLAKVNFRWVDLAGANLSGADLRGADLTGTILRGTDLTKAKLTKAYLTNAQLIETNFENANLTGCSIYGISAWNLKLQGVVQSDLIITPPGEPDITVDNLEVAQFIYLLLHNEKIRHVIDTITSKVVLILGRFTPERKVVLDALREELRKRNYSPVLFDFEKPASRDLTETISTLAHMSRFIIADITDAKSIPQELQAIVPDLPSVPVQPLLESSYREYAMFEHFRRYPWFLETYYYDSIGEVLASLKEKVINPAEAKAKELQMIKR